MFIINALWRTIAGHLKCPRQSTMLKKLLAAAVGITFCVSQALAQDYPTRTVKIIVPFPAGQASDVMARVVGEQLARRLNQAVIIENRVGAGGVIGTEVGANAKADGYTLTMATAALPISKYVRPMKIDPAVSFEPIALMTVTPLVLVTRPDLPANDVRSLLEMAAKDPMKYTVASSGVGTSHHLSAELFQHMGQVKMLHVPYQGSSAAHLDLLAGRVDMMFDNIIPLTPHLNKGSLKALAVTTQERSDTQRDIPTMSEAGYPQFEAVAWFGLLAPKDTPAEIVQHLHSEVNQVLAMPEVAEKLREMGAFPQKKSQQEFAQFVQAEFTKWGDLIQEADVKIE